MKRETAERLLDAKHACLEIETFTAGKTIDNMWTERSLQLSLHKLLEIVGEALNQASTSDATVVSDVPNLRRFIAVRNRITHGYNTVDYSIVWQVCTEHIPRLIPSLDALLESAPPLPDQNLTEHQD